MSLQVNRIKIANILGIESLEIEPGKVTVISGRNGSGKTSALEAIKAATKGGHDATLLRNGAEFGETVLLLDDGSKIQKRVTPDASKQRFVNADGEADGRAATAISRLVDALSVNPIEFLTTRKKDQIDALLEAMPLKTDAAKLAEIIGGPVAPELGKAHAMLAIDQVRQGIFDARTGVNRSIRDKKGTIAQLEAAIPEALADTDAVNETDLEQAIADADAARDKEFCRIDTKLAEMEATWEQQLADIDAQIARLQEERTDVLATRVDTRGKAEAQRQKTRAKCDADKRPAQDKLNLIRANRDAAAKARATRETITKMQDELGALIAEEERSTSVLERLDAYKADLLSNLPIPGLRVSGGEIYYGDVLFERLNTAQQMRVAVEIAKLRAGELALVCVDGAEALDDEAFDALCSQAVESGVQLVVTRVSDGPLTIETQP